MGTLYVLIHEKQYKNKSMAIRKNNQNEALSVLNWLILKEKCLNLAKISKRNTGYQVYSRDNSNNGIAVYNKCNITI
ncbi:hypothetical protein F8154_07360 [Alkaliphilus pronyensis]|uniref:Uncharacterized protein n=1 Tax=Alkaliphilus pronyensis TaxID=1482732 RepID=A0A6I0FG86_9FIRM|nr:hypothetical protein [Alkaliphilus pronyensis]KAB3535251.1 hypothetical protein F8154_07360 [Alkaliphilus pronyensis]